MACNDLLPEPRAASSGVKTGAISNTQDAAAGLSRAAIERSLLLIGFLVILGVFYVFTYNSGYGYDALEYLVIGRGLSRGAAFYSLVPSKSPGIYYLIAALFWFGVPATHSGVSALVTFLFAVTIISTWLIVRPLLGRKIAFVATLLVGASAVFMEMNFLEPESIVALFGLIAYALVLGSLKSSRFWSAFWAGVCLAISFQFKSVALLYGLGIGGFLLFRFLRGCLKPVTLSKVGSGLASGFILGVVIPVIAFGVVGRAGDYWLWTIEFPLFHYPPNTIWLDRLYTKLLWFHFLLVIAIITSLSTESRRSIWESKPVVLAFFMGLASYLALLKTQASHYCFPGAVFFSIFIAGVGLISSDHINASWRSVRRIGLIAVGATVLIVISVVFYRPGAVRRLLEWRDFGDEQAVQSLIQGQVQPGQKALFVRNGSLLYWLADVEPSFKFVSFDVQTSYFVERQPNAMLDALRDRSTALVEFNPSDPGFEDSGFEVLARRSGLLEEFTQTLQRDFRPLQVTQVPYKLWVRRN